MGVRFPLEIPGYSLPSEMSAGGDSARALEPGVTVDSAPRKTAIPAGEFWVGIAIFAVAFLLRLRYASTAHWNSDEPQHLHVVWAWANGMLPYRDVFDNHSPMFAWMYSPLFRCLGERPDIVTPMRLGLIPFHVLSIWCTWKIGASIFSRRVGWWAAVALALAPSFYFLMGEFRSDGPWTALWLGVLAVLLGGRLSAVRWFFVGLLLGITFAISMKTTFLVIVLGAAGLVTLAVRWSVLGWREALRGMVPALALLPGLLIVPGAFLLYFASQGVLGQMHYCVIEHNLVSDGSGLSELLRRVLKVRVLLVPLTVVGAFWFRDTLRTGGSSASRRMFFFCVAGLFVPLLRVLWPVISRQDFAPFHPLVVLLLAAGGVWVAERLRGRFRAAGALLLVVAGCVEIGLLLRERNINGRSNRSREAEIAEVLRLTNPAEYVMDAKGVMIFRPSPYFYALETMTRRRLRMGLLRDEIRERMIATKTAVIYLKILDRLTDDARAFVQENYVPVGGLAVLGKMFEPASAAPIRFDVAVAERYLVVTPSGAASGTLDGRPLDGSRELGAGEHVLQLSLPSDRAALVWARAIERGFSPFTTPEK